MLRTFGPKRGRVNGENYTVKTFRVSYLSVNIFRVIALRSERWAEYVK